MRQLNNKQFDTKQGANPMSHRIPNSSLVSIKKDETMKNKYKVTIENKVNWLIEKGSKITYWVNKKTGTTHIVSSDVDYDGDLKLSTSTINLYHERFYFFRKESVLRFLKNYELVSENPTDEFYTKVLANKQLKRDLSFGLRTKGRVGVSKKLFFYLMGDK